MLRIISLAFAMLVIIVGGVAAQRVHPTRPVGIPGMPPPPPITVNGASGGTMVTAGASMSLAVANGMVT
jgi:hypothetical protein